jgi:hypothetical protein
MQYATNQLTPVHTAINIPHECAEDGPVLVWSRMCTLLQVYSYFWSMVWQSASLIMCTNSTNFSLILKL